MATQPSKGSGDDDDAPAPAKPKPAGGKRTIILILGALLLCAGGGYWAFGRSGRAGEAQAVPVKPAAFVDIRELVVNLAPEPNQERARFLKFKVALEVSDAKTVPSIQPYLPRVEDALQVLVRELRASDLEGSAGLYRLREELLRRVNVAVYPAKVDAVLFKDLVVQ